MFFACVLYAFFFLPENDEQRLHFRYPFDEEEIVQNSRATEKPSFPAMRHMTPELVGNDGSGPRCLGKSCGKMRLEGLEVSSSYYVYIYTYVYVYDVYFFDVPFID